MMQNSVGDIDYGAISRLCEGHLHTYGKDVPQGVGWFNKDLFVSRQLAMLGVILETHKNTSLSILDVGCGTGALLDAIKICGIKNVHYTGCDLSPVMVEAAAQRWPGQTFYTADLLKDDVSHWPAFDYVIMSGVLTARCGLDYISMTLFAKTMLKRIFSLARVGIAFNTMSPHVDWEDELLFHWPTQDACTFLVKECSRHIQMRMDYGGYENTYYVYKDRVIHEPV